MSGPATGSPTPITVVVMGVSGAGKSAVARALAECTGWTMAEGDDFHPAANVAKMAAGEPLRDEDRWPWLRGIADWIGTQELAGHSSVVTCSALRRSYRDLLRAGHHSVRFCQLDAVTTTLQARLEGRRDHYMPPSLLTSQLATLQSLEDDEPGWRVDAEGDVVDVVRQVLQALADEKGHAGVG
ncbi:MAG: gluconokinase [Geodermatophilaceae bacterium]|nr:gluconokinase [Geodermatophilaceae bacterium]